MNGHQKLRPLHFLLLGMLLAVTLIMPIPTRSSDSLQQTAAFLQAPYYGSTSVSSIFDHDANGGRILAFTGAAAEANNCPCPDAPPGGCVDPEFTRGYYSCDTHGYLYYDGHDGIDYVLRYDYVRAAAAGPSGPCRMGCARQPRTTWRAPGAVRACVDHDNGYQTCYDHLSVLCVQT